MAPDEVPVSPVPALSLVPAHAPAQRPIQSGGLGRAAAVARQRTSRVARWPASGRGRHPRLRSRPFRDCGRRRARLRSRRTRERAILRDLFSEAVRRDELQHRRHVLLRLDLRQIRLGFRGGRCAVEHALEDLIEHLPGGQSADAAGELGCLDDDGQLLGQPAALELRDPFVVFRRAGFPIEQRVVNAARDVLRVGAEKNQADHASVSTDHRGGGFLRWLLL